LKPENLLLVSESEDAIIKLADFGLAARAAANTLTGFCGSPGYIAPEILCDTPHGRCDLEYGCHTNLLRLIGKPVDMWAIGIITYVLLGGYLPFDDPDKARTNKLIKRGIFEFHEMYWGEVSEEAKSLIRGLLTVDVNQRITAQQAMNHPWVSTLCFVHETSYSLCLCLIIIP
jgi:serine/threonine protein kinase